MWDLHLLISRPKVYPIVAQKPRGEIKACVIQWLLYHPGPALPLRGLLLRWRQRGEREYKTLTWSRLRLQPWWVSFKDLISPLCNYIYIPLCIPLISIWPHLHVFAGNMNSHELHMHWQKKKKKDTQPQEQKWVESFFRHCSLLKEKHFSLCRSNLVFVF